MLMAHPTVLRTLLDRYETLRDHVEAQEPGRVDPRLGQQLQDTVYTLCVSTGTREIGPALAAARAHVDRNAFTERRALPDESAA
ncbi:DUF5133 domain-containing protein [Streptomyces sp. V4-01]|uniref:DUF5133 domain-containing protein n=1 Tax=Actinacidiphila polyblastidii TaxID=3110430 RepID=A0ABU7PAC1_9ACTN|nr:DUF5133 domain-containing protein [Streptomyces sp. V4-01]